jgi:Tol biopolymer transport system component
VTQQEWKTFGDFEHIGATAFSPDDSKIAFVSEHEGRKVSFTLLDISTEQMASIAHLSGVPEAATLSWSPNGKQFVVELQKPGQPSVIAIVDVNVDDIKVIGKGVNPTWSPTGEWIAYSDETRQRCILVHPDGTGTRVVRDLKRMFGYRMLPYGTVWSPDGTRLLFNEMKGEGPYLDVVLLDLASRKATSKSHDGLAVFGWAKQKR